MNIKRAIGIIFLLSVASAGSSEIPGVMWYVAIASVAVLSGFGTIWFFKSPETVPNAKNGFLFGLMAAAIGFIGDILLLVPHKNGLNLLLGYYTQIKYWAAFVSILTVCTLVGYIKSKNKR